MKRSNFDFEQEVYLHNGKVLSVDTNTEIPCLQGIVTSEENVYQVVLEIETRQEDRPCKRDGWSDTNHPDESINDRNVVRGFVIEKTLEGNKKHVLNHDQKIELFNQFESQIYETEV